MIFYEWCDRPQNRSGIFVTGDKLETLKGFRSVYGFKTKPDSSKGLNQFPVYSDTLFLDFDQGLSDNFRETVSKLKDNDFRFSTYLSGSKGAHIHADLLPMFGDSVPDAQRAFIETLGAKEADLSIYRHGSLIRLPGTIHEKTNQPKELLEYHDGHFALEIDYTKEFKTPSRFSGLKTTEDKFKIAVSLLRLHLGTAPKIGMRYVTLWSVARNFAESDLSFDSTLELIQQLNHSWGELQKDDAELLRAVKDAFK